MRLLACFAGEIACLVERGSSARRRRARVKFQSPAARGRLLSCVLPRERFLLLRATTRETPSLACCFMRENSRASAPREKKSSLASRSNKHEHKKTHNEADKAKENRKSTPPEAARADNLCLLNNGTNCFFARRSRRRQCLRRSDLARLHAI
jgi:hypothetical protein